MAWDCMALQKVWFGIPGGEIPSGRMRIEAVQPLKNGIPFFTKVKLPSPTKHELTHPLQHPASQTRRQPAERPNEHARVLEPATVTEVGIRIVPLSRHSDGMAAHVSAETGIRSCEAPRIALHISHRMFPIHNLKTRRASFKTADAHIYTLNQV